MAKQPGKHGKPGRPSLPEGEGRNNYIKVRLSEVEKAEFMVACEGNLQNPSAVIRALMKKYVITGNKL